MCDEPGRSGGRCFLDEACPFHAGCRALVAEKFTAEGIDLSRLATSWSLPGERWDGLGEPGDGEFGGKLVPPFSPGSGQDQEET